MIKDTYQLIDQLSVEMEKHRRWHPRFISPYGWAMMRMELNMELATKAIGDKLRDATNSATVAMSNFAETLKGAM